MEPTAEHEYTIHPFACPTKTTSTKTLKCFCLLELITLAACKFEGTDCSQDRIETMQMSRQQTNSCSMWLID